MRGRSNAAACVVAVALAMATGTRPVVAKPAKRHTAAHRAPAAHRRTRTAPAPTPAVADTSAVSNDDVLAPSSDAADAPADAKAAGKIKTKTYTFGAMDVEGKLKTPQLLYFLNRVKLELDMSAPDKRSFMKELGQSADDKSL
jgi:hypothetical protein